MDRVAAQQGHQPRALVPTNIISGVAHGTLPRFATVQAFFTHGPKVCVTSLNTAAGTGLVAGRGVVPPLAAGTAGKRCC